MPTRAPAAGVMLAVCLALAGCGGGGGVAVDGKAVNGANPYSPEADGDMTINLGAAGKSYSGRVQPDGSFKITAAEGGNVPPGKYAVTATRYPKPGQVKPGQPPMPANYKLDESWDVSSSNQHFTLDVTKLKPAQ